MTVPLDTRQDIRVMDALGVPRAQIARSLGVSRNTVAKYADMEDMSPAAPVPRERPLTAVGPHAAWIVFRSIETALVTNPAFHPSS